jgi:hypothetical protein
VRRRVDREHRVLMGLLGAFVGGIRTLEAGALGRGSGGGHGSIEDTDISASVKGKPAVRVTMLLHMRALAVHANEAK